ncbi:hypothetical protein SK128_026400 [Halocaridina rubra]|uniref:Histone-lysine N-methyltransferase trithorax n=1 Tax=Halocaridina rubra TaxID=373956 RepID=A0AAN9A1B4_HALRR
MTVTTECIYFQMMECGRCGEWIHAHCEGLNNEHYQILSFLPDSVEYVCRICIMEEESNWLDAVNKELAAGCEAVIQSLINSKCAKHLVKREINKLSLSGLSSLSYTSSVISNPMQKQEMLLEHTKASVGGEKLVLTDTQSSVPLAVTSSGAGLFDFQTDLGNENITGNDAIPVLENENSDNSSHIVSSAFNQDNGCGAFSSASEGDVVINQPTVRNHYIVESHVHSAENSFMENAVITQINTCNTDIANHTGTEQTTKNLCTISQTYCGKEPAVLFKDLLVENSTQHKTNCKEDRGEKLLTSDNPNQGNTKLRLKRCRMRSSSAWTSLGPPVCNSITNENIRLKECSVRLKDICKSRSPSLSPRVIHDSDNDDKHKKNPITFTPVSSSSLPEYKTAEAVSEAITNLNISKAIHDNGPELCVRENLQTLLDVKDAGVSCTQVDGPNDETTTAAHVIRNLFYDSRSPALLESASVRQETPESPSCEKSDDNVIDMANKININNNSTCKSTDIACLENRFISPKYKITKDIDDDCVSSEVSSFCDTDTEIESIQDDPDEPKDLLSVREKLRDGKYNSLLQFHVDTARVIEFGKHLNRSQTRNILTSYTKHMKDCFPWFNLKGINIFELVDKKRSFPVPFSDHNYASQSQNPGSLHYRFTPRDVPTIRKRNCSPLKGVITHDHRKCVLCGQEGDGDPNSTGRLLYLGQDEWMHINCGLWSSEVYEEVDGGLQNVYLAVNRGRLVKCSMCQERGATVGCCHKTCQATYHFMCARQSVCQFMEDKRIYCPVHMSSANGVEKSDDFLVNRCVYVDMDSEKKKWKQVAGNRVNIIIGSLIIRNLGKIVPESDSAEALIPVDFSCSRKYWSTVDPTKQVSYTCRTKRVIPTSDDSLLGEGAEIHRTIDHSLGEDAVQREMTALRKWFKQLEESKVEKKSRETNIIPPHLCPLYRSIKERDSMQIIELGTRCCTPPSVVESDVRQCIEDIIDKVSRSVEEESLLFDSDLPAIVSAADNELISMVLNDLDACDPITLHSTPSTSGRPSPLDIDFLSTCDHMMDSGKVSHSGNLTQEAQETVCDSQVMLEEDVSNTAATLAPVLQASLSHSSIQSQSSNSHDHIHQEGYDEQLTPALTDTFDDIKESFVDTVSPPPSNNQVPMPSTLELNLSREKSCDPNSSSNSTSDNSTSSSSESKSDSNSSSCSNSKRSASSSIGVATSSPESCIAGVISNNSSPDTCSRVLSENLGNTDSSSSNDSSQSMRCATQNSSALLSAKANSALKQICRVLPMPSTQGRRSSSASEHSDAVSFDVSPPVSRRSPRNFVDDISITPNGRRNDRKKICMKRNYKTVIKKYPLRSGMRKSKPYETVQIEINETIEIPRGEGSGMMRKSRKRKWSGILDTDEENDRNNRDSCELEGTELTLDHCRNEDDSKENSVSKKVLKFSDDSSDITVSIVNNNNNLCDFSKSRVHKYRHKTVLQLDGAADGSSSSAEMSESQDEGMIGDYQKIPKPEDSQSPPPHSTLAMRIKEQSLARSSPGEEGPYKCGKCKRLYRTKESYQKHIETCTFEVDSSSTSDDEEDHDLIKIENEAILHSLPLPINVKVEDIEDSVVTSVSEDESAYECNTQNVHSFPQPEDVKIEDIEDSVISLVPKAKNEHKCDTHNVPDAQNTSDIKLASQEFATSQNISLIENIVSNLETKRIAGSAGDLMQDYSDVLGRPKFSGEEPTIKKSRIDTNLPRQPGVHRQVRTAIKKSPLARGDDVELLQVVQGVPSPGTEVFVPPPVSPVKYNPIMKKNVSPRRYSNVRLMRGGRNYQYRRAPPQLPSQEHYQGTSNIHMNPATATPIQVTVQPMGNTSAQILTPAPAATFQPFSGQTGPYSPSPQLTSPVAHISPAVQIASPVPPPMTQQVSPQVNPQAQLLTVVSAPPVAVPQGYALQYVGSFRDDKMGSGGGSLVTYPTAPVVVPQPQFVVAPQQSSVVMSQMVNTNITYSFATPETLVINQPAVVPGMQPVQYLGQQQQQLAPQTQVMQSHTEQQIGSVMQYGQSGLSPQQTSQVASHSSHHLQPSGQIPSSCLSFSDVHNNQICVSQQPQTLPPTSIMSRELSFQGLGSKPVLTTQPICSTISAFPTPSVNLPVSTNMGLQSTPMVRQRPQASVAPQIIQPLPTVTAASFSDGSSQENVSHSRLPFAGRPLTGIVRTVATVAPAVITTTSVVSISTCSSSTKLTSADSSPKVATVRPRPTYSYRDAMRDKQLERQKQRQDMLQLDASSLNDKPLEFMKGKENMECAVSDSESDSEYDTAGRNVLKDKEDRLETQSYKLVLRKDSSARTGFNVLPVSGPDAPLPAPEVKELRIKAKVSVGPKRKKAKCRDADNDLIIACKDTSQDLYVNEQLPNFSVNPMHNPVQDDPSIFEKPKSCNSEPYIVFELTSEDGFHVESRHISEVWQKVFDAVSAARASMKMDSKYASNIQDIGHGGAMSGLHMLGLTHNAVQYLLEQLPGAKDCHKYSFQFHRRPQEEGAVEENPSGCARTESFKVRSPYDIFSWLASKHRRMPEKALFQQEEIQLSTTRRATSLELPMAMRYRHLRETAREAVGVFRSSIHGRGLFCKRDIDSGEMVIEYAGQVIRSSMCDMREKDYESKGIGCYMFRIDDDTVIDATMHGNAARFINHSCDPNCYSRVVDILGKKHIIIFALRRIIRGEELTYDYKFPIEDDKIPCTCGARRCRKYLN